MYSFARDSHGFRTGFAQDSHGILTILSVAVLRCSPKGYTFAQKVIDGMTVDIAAVNIRMELSGVPLESEDSVRRSCE